MQEQSLSLGS